MLDQGDEEDSKLSFDQSLSHAYSLTLCFNDLIRSISISNQDQISGIRYRIKSINIDWIELILYQIKWIETDLDELIPCRINL